MIVDDQTTALDVVGQKEVLGLIREIQLEMGSSVVFVTHDTSVHANITDRVGIIYAGRLVEEGPTHQMFLGAPASLYRPSGGEPAAYRGHDAASRARGKTAETGNPPAGCRFHPRCSLAVHMQLFGWVGA